MALKKTKGERELVKKFHEFAHIWREHAADEVRIHKQMVGGHRNLKRHVRETIRIHKKLLTKLKKFI